MDSSLFRSVSRAKFELCRNGRRWIWREETVGVRTEKEKKKTKHENTWKRTAATCRAALYSIWSFRGAWRPWMFLSVEKFILSWFNWNCSWRNTENSEIPTETYFYYLHFVSIVIKLSCIWHNSNFYSKTKHRTQIPFKHFMKTALIGLMTHIFFWQLQRVAWKQFILNTGKSV